MKELNAVLRIGNIWKISQTQEGFALALSSSVKIESIKQFFAVDDSEKELLQILCSSKIATLLTFCEKLENKQQTFTVSTANKPRRLLEQKSERNLDQADLDRRELLQRGLEFSFILSQVAPETQEDLLEAQLFPHVEFSQIEKLWKMIERGVITTQQALFVITVSPSDFREVTM